MKFKKSTLFIVAAVLVIACGFGVWSINNNNSSTKTNGNNDETVDVSNEENVDENSNDNEKTYDDDDDDDVITTKTKNGTKVTKKKNSSTNTTDTTKTVNGKKYHVLTIDGNEYLFSDDIDTYLIMGTDLSGNEDCNNNNGYGSKYRGSMADYLCVVVVDHTTKSYSRIEVNRDTMSKVKVYYSDSDEYAYSQTMQICCAHWYGTN